MEITKIERKDRTQYGVRSFSWQGIVSGCLLIVQVILLVTAVYLSYLAQGEGSIAVGILGVAVFMLALVSAAFAVWGLCVKNHHHGTCYIGGAGSVIVMAAIILICTAL